MLLVVPERVLFDVGSHELRADARERLADLAGRQLNRRVEILVRTDEPIPGS